MTGDTTGFDEDPTVDSADLVGKHDTLLPVVPPSWSGSLWPTCTWTNMTRVVSTQLTPLPRLRRWRERQQADGTESMLTSLFSPIDTGKATHDLL